MAEAVKDAVNQVVDGVKDLAVAAEQKAPKAAKPKKEKKKGGDSDGRPLMLEPAPAYIDHRVQILYAGFPTTYPPSHTDFRQREAQGQV
jgi:threonyl-tRNA synthetase